MLTSHPSSCHQASIHVHSLRGRRFARKSGGLLLAMVLSLMACGHANGQSLPMQSIEQTLASTIAAQTTADEASPQQEHTNTVTIHFTGGSLYDYLEALKDATPEKHINLALRGPAEAVPMGPVDLVKVPIDIAMKMVEGDYAAVAFGNPTRYRVLVTDYTYDFDSSNNMPSVVYTIDIQGSSKQVQSASTASQTHLLVLSLNEITQPMPGVSTDLVVPAQTVLTAVEASLSMFDQTASEVNIKYHTESGLLIVTGSQQAINAASDVVSSIQQDLHIRREAAHDLLIKQGLGDPDKLRDELADAHWQLKNYEQQLAKNLQQLHILQTSINMRITKQQQAPDTNETFQVANEQLLKIEQSVDIYKRMIDETQDRIATLTADLARSRKALGLTDDATESLAIENAHLRKQIEELTAKLQSIQPMQHSEMNQ